MKQSFPSILSNRKPLTRMVGTNPDDILPISEDCWRALTRIALCGILLSADNRMKEVPALAPRLGDAIHQARQARKLTLRQLAEQVTKDDGTPISPQYLNDIELHHRVPTPHV